MKNTGKLKKDFLEVIRQKMIWCQRGYSIIRKEEFTGKNESNTIILKAYDMVLRDV